MTKTIALLTSFLLTTSFVTAMDEEKNEIVENKSSSNSSSSQKLSEQFGDLLQFAKENKNKLQELAKNLSLEVEEKENEILHMHLQSSKATSSANVMSKAKDALSMLSDTSLALESTLEDLNKLTQEFDNEKTDTSSLSQTVLQIYTKMKKKKAGDLCLFGDEKDGRPSSIISVGQNLFMPGTKLSSMKHTFEIECDNEKESNDTSWTLTNGQKGKFGINDTEEHSGSYSFVTWKDNSTLILVAPQKTDKDPKFVNTTQLGKQVSQFNLSGNTSVKISAIFGDTEQKRIESSVSTSSAGIVWSVAQLLTRVKSAKELKDLWQVAVDQVTLDLKNFSTVFENASDILKNAVESVQTIDSQKK